MHGIPLAPRTLGFLLLPFFATPVGMAADRDGPFDRWGRPLRGAQGAIHYRWQGDSWKRVERGIVTGTVEGPDPALDPGPGARPRSHSAYTLGGYKETMPGSWPDTVAIGDVTGDGRNDVVLVTASYFDPANDYHVFVYPQTGTGSLGTPTSYPYDATASRTGIVLADLDEDGTLDVVVGHRSGISVLLADGSGGLRPARVISDADADTLAAMDVDRDGHLDIISLGWSRGASIFHGDGAGGFRPVVAFATHASGYNEHEVEDLDDDGIRDLAVMTGQGTAPQLSVHRHDGGSAFLAAADGYTTGESAGGVGLGDVSGDCRADAVLSRPRNSPTQLWILRQDGLGGLSGPTTIASYDVPEPIEVADLDGDGIEDVVTLHGGWNRIGVYLNHPGSGLEAEVLYAIPYASHYRPQGLAIGDFTGDGCPDVAIADYNQGLVTLQGQGCATACAAVPLADAGSPLSSCGSADVILDGGASQGCVNTRLRYRWLDGTSPVCDWSERPTCRVSPTATTTYTLEIHLADSPGCTASDTVTVTMGAGPTAAAGADQSVCAGEGSSLDGAASSGCSSGYLHRWSDASGILCDWNSVSTCNVSPTATTTYTLEVVCVGQPDCLSSDTVTIAVEAAPPASAGPDRGACAGDTLTLDASATLPCPGPLAQEFQWLEGGVPVCTPTPLPTCQVTPSPGVHTYTVEVRCAGWTCVGRDDVVVTLHLPPAADAGPDLSVCAGQSARLEAGTTSGCVAPATLLFRWLDGALEVCPWSGAPFCSVSPTATTTYTLEVACSDATGCLATDGATVTVTPDIVPPSAGNSLRAVRALGNVDLSWSIVPPAPSYNLHRSTQKGSWPPLPWRTGLATPGSSEPDLAGPPDLYLYRAVGASCSGIEGP